MSNENILEGLFPAPQGVKLRSRHFGANPVSELKEAPAPGQAAHSPFRIDWKDLTLKLSVSMREDQPSGRLLAEVHCEDAKMLNKAAVSVAIVGTVEAEMIRKTIQLDRQASNGCAGAADYGSLADAVQKLGTRLGLVVILLV